MMYLTLYALLMTYDDNKKNGRALWLFIGLVYRNIGKQHRQVQ
jgi:hypothetical protein